MIYDNITAYVLCVFLHILFAYKRKILPRQNSWHEIWP